MSNEFSKIVRPLVVWISLQDKMSENMKYYIHEKRTICQNAFY